MAVTVIYHHADSQAVKLLHASVVSCGAHEAVDKSEKHIEWRQLDAAG